MHGVCNLGPDLATAEIMAAAAVVWPAAKSVSPLPMRAETETWWEAFRGFGDRKSCSENPASNESAVICNCVGREHLW